jgi:hypothetical protein
VEWINVVENERVAKQQAQPKDKKIQTPDHLQHSHHTKICFGVKERKVAKTSHPNVARYEQANGVVHGRLVKVMIRKEQVLHPTLPLFRLLAVQKCGALDATLVLHDVVHGPYDKQAPQAPKHQRVAKSFSVLHSWHFLTHPSVAENGAKLGPVPHAQPD